MRLVSRDHVLSLRFNVEGVLKHVENEREIYISKILEVAPFSRVLISQIILEEEAIVPCLVEIGSRSCEEQVPKFRDLSPTSGDQIPFVEVVHEEVEVI